MGAGIAQLALTAGHEVIVYDVDEAAIDRARARIGDGLDRLAAKGRLDTAGAAAALARLRDATELDALGSEADIVVEAALEDIGLKRDIFRALDSAATGPAVLATNTSALSVTAIAEGALEHPERVVGLHFFNPAPLMTLVELVSGELSDAYALDRAEAFARGLGKTTVRCRDAPGFIVNRVNRPFTLEALRMIEAGEATITAVDDAITGAGFPMGPFALMDLVGIDVNYAVARTLWQAFDHASRFEPSPIQEMLVAAEHVGRKSSEGFFRYGPGGKPIGPADEFADASPGGALRPDEIVERITLAIVNEAHRALGEGVATMSDIDLALKLGANHPWGPFERVAAVGGAARVRDALWRLERTYGARFTPAPLLAAYERSHGGGVAD
jgi:3-hydroxybutyryl-CoA dehydrogenase